ncbi:hypothetical protein [Streptomyces sp. NPDC001135]
MVTSRVLDVRHADIHDLPMPDHTADRARTDRVLQHVADPWARSVRSAGSCGRVGGSSWASPTGKPWPSTIRTAT